MDQHNKYPNWPVIVNKSLVSSNFMNIFRQHQMKVRVSNTTLENTVIFPLSGVAFMILSLNIEDPDQLMRSELMNKIHKFTHIHKICYVLVLATLHGPRETEVFEEIQMRFLHTKLQMIPVHNANEGAQAMVTIAKALCKPESEKMYKQLPSSVTCPPTSDVMSSILAQAGLNEHHILSVILLVLADEPVMISVIQDGLGSLSNLASATISDMQECSLDMDAVTRIHEILREPAVKQTNVFKAEKSSS